MMVTVVNTSKGLTVHHAACADLQKAANLMADRWGLEADTLREVVEDTYGPQAGSFYAEQGFSADDPDAWESFAGEFRVMGCAAGLK